MSKLWKRIKEVEGHYEEWWKGTNTEPIICVSYPETDFNIGEYKKGWMPENIDENWLLAYGAQKFFETGESSYIHEACAILKEYIVSRGYLADAYPQLFTNFGPGNLAANITNYSLFNDNTIWFELPEAMEWEEIQALGEDVRKPYADIYSQSIDIAMETIGEDCILSFPDMSSSLDVLASLRQSQNLLMDLMMEPDKVHEALAKLQKIWYRYQKEYFDQLEKTNKAYCTGWLYVLCKGRFYLDQSDFSAMISPEMFAEFALPRLKENMSHFDYGIYHLDGPGELELVDHLCSIEKLHAIQWVPGAGLEPEADEKWYPLFRQIIDHGKKIILMAHQDNLAEALTKVFKKFPKKEFCILNSAKSKEDAENLVKTMKI